MHTESVKQGCVNLRGQGQRSSQGQVTKMTYFKTKRTVILRGKNEYGMVWPKI